MTACLYAWHEGTPVGRFLKESGRITFEYDGSYAGLPISLSMPVDGPWDEDAPGRVLTSRLPEDGNTRLMQAIALEAGSDDPFDVLPLTDSAGGLVFTSDENPPEALACPLQPCSMEEIEARVSKIAGGGTSSWWPEKNPGARFSLAGSQGKFTLSEIGGRWYWPTAGCPSSHIFKPEARMAPGSCSVEASSMRLARLTGMPTAYSYVDIFGSAECYVVLRFDRDGVGPSRRRLRTEELMFSIGMPDEDKYGAEVRDVVARMRRIGLADDLIYQWVSQVMVNMSVGNCDAHLRNYSLILEGSAPTLSPMYDVVTTTAWPAFDNAFALMVNGQCMACRDFTPHDWEEEARACGLDPDRISFLAKGISASVLGSLDQVADGVDSNRRDAFVEAIRDANKGMEPESVPDDDLVAAMGETGRDGGNYAVSQTKALMTRQEREDNGRAVDELSRSDDIDEYHIDEIISDVTRWVMEPDGPSNHSRCTDRA